MPERPSGDTEVVHEAYPVRGFGQAAIVGMLVVAVVSVTNMVMSWSAVGLIRQAREQRDVGLIERAGGLWQPLYWFNYLLTLTVAIIVVTWFYRARRNLAAIPAATPRFSPFWTIACWFIPGVNLVLPGLVVDEIAKESVPADRGLRRLVWGWWLGVVVAEVGALAVAYFDVPGPRPPGSFYGPAGFQSYVDYFERNFFWSLPLNLLFLVAGGLLAVAIRRVSRAQHVLLPELDAGRRPRRRR